MIRSTVPRRSVDAITNRVANNRLLAQSRHGDGPDPLIPLDPFADIPAMRPEMPKQPPELPATPNTVGIGPDLSSADIVYLGGADQPVGIDTSPSPPPARNKFIAGPAVHQAKLQVSPVLFDYIDTNAAAALPRAELEIHLAPVLTAILADLRINLPKVETLEGKLADPRKYLD